MGRSRVASAIGLAMLMALSTIGAPAAAQDAAVDPRQPSPENPHMHVYGTSDLSNCFTHFDGNDTSGSANEGYGEKEWTGNNQQIEVDYTCRMEGFKQDMYLSENGSISIHLEFEIDAADCQSDADVCENLNLTLYKGGFLIRDSHPYHLTTGGVHRRNDDCDKPGLNRSSGLTCSCTRLLCPCCPDAKTQPSLICRRRLRLATWFRAHGWSRLTRFGSRRC